MAENKKDKNIKIKPIPVAILAAVLCVLVIGGIVFAVFNQDHEDAEVQLGFHETDLKLENVTAPVSQVKTTIEILFEDSAIPVGTTLQMSALVTPEDTEHALSWSSNNEAVFTVSADGVVTVTGTGTAALTATLGNVADAVAIEGIATVTSGSLNQYPVYTGGTGSTGTGNNGTGSNGTGSNGTTGNGDSNVASNGNAGNGGTGTDSIGTGNTGTGNSDNSGVGDNQSGNTGANQGGGTGTGQGGSSTGGNSEGNNGSGNSATPSESTGASSQELAGTLIGNGFTQMMSNVYVCQENDVYYGEIVTQPNVTIVYIKERTASFDGKILSVLSTLLPAEYQQVWNNYISAATDRTFTAEGRRVRIVAAAGGGHSQIVIYN